MTGAARRGHLELYLEPFRHTVAVMQTPEALTRVAAECAEDLAADGVVYAEVRFAPELHLDRGLRLDQVVEAVLEGFRQGSAAQARGSWVAAHQMSRHVQPMRPISSKSQPSCEATILGQMRASSAGRPPVGP